jgi:FkbM family methyltransferase
MDGVCYSNSLFFEKYMGWSGILIEPSHEFFKLIKNRPNAKCYKFVISETEGQVDFIGAKSEGHLSALAGVVDTLYEASLKEFDKYNDKSVTKIESIPLKKLLHGVKKVNLFSIDVEGGEYEVLSTFDWDIPVHVVLLENIEEHKMEKCRSLLRERGFTYEGPIAHNEAWVNHNFKHD